MADERPGPDSTRRDLLALRTTLARELDTINEYERLIEQAGSDEVKKLLAHLRDDEKEHVAECLHYIRKLDAVQERFLGADVEAHVGTKKATYAAPLPKAPGSPETAAFTVGSLRRR